MSATDEHRTVKPRDCFVHAPSSDRARLPPTRRGRSARLRRLFESIAQRKDARVVPFAADDAHASYSGIVGGARPGRAEREDSQVSASL